VFHGFYGYIANYEAFKLIQDYLAPEIWRRNRNIQFVLAGTDVPKFERENIKSVGYVDDLSTFLADSDIAIVPILHGTGVGVKMFDYMAAGLPIISTRIGIRGIEAENGVHAIILDTVGEKFIQAILKLADNPLERQRLGRNAHELGLKHYSREAAQKKLDQVLDSLQKQLAKASGS